MAKLSPAFMYSSKPKHIPMNSRLSGLHLILLSSHMCMTMST